MAPWDEIIKTIAEIGYEGTEVQQAFQADESAEMSAVADQFAAHGLTGTTIYVGGSYHEAAKTDECLGKVKLACERMAALNGEIVVVANGGGGSRRDVAGRVKPEDMLSDDEFKVLAETLNRAGEICKANGMVACYHNHAATYIETPEEIDRLMDMTDPDLLALNPDTGHYCVGGGDCVEFIRKYGSRVKYMHLKDCEPGELAKVRSGEIDWNQFARGNGWAELRDGVIDMAGVVAALKDIDYDGWLMVEQDNSPNPPEVAAAKNYAYLRELV